MHCRTLQNPYPSKIMLMENKSTGKKHQSSRANGLLTAILLASLIYMATVQVKAWWAGQSATKITPRAVTPRADLGKTKNQQFVSLRKLHRALFSLL